MRWKTIGPHPRESPRSALIAKNYPVSWEMPLRQRAETSSGMRVIDGDEAVWPSKPDVVPPEFQTRIMTTPKAAGSALIGLIAGYPAAAWQLQAIGWNGDRGHR